MGSSTARVLVVDDDPRLGRLMRRYLQEHFDVTSVGSAFTAIELAKRQDFVAVICDVSMPGLSGPEFFELMKEKIPGLSTKLGFVTGGMALEEVSSAVGASGRPYLEKPFKRQQLLDFVNMLAAA